MMKNILVGLAVVFGMATGLRAGTICEITAHVFALKAKDAGEFMLAHNPAGQAGVSLEVLDQWAEQGKARSLGTVTTKGQPGLRTQAEGKEFALDAETVASGDKQAVSTVVAVTVGGEKVLSGVTCPKDQFTFAGNTAPKEGDPEATVYLVYLLARVSEG